MGTFVPSCRTVWTPSEAALALGRAYRAARAMVPDAETLACLVGQGAAETLHFRECFNHCPGNVRATPRCAGLYTLRPAGECIAGASVYYHPPLEYPCDERDAWLQLHPDSRPDVIGSCFRAFSTIAEGAQDYVDFLARRGFLGGAETGNPAEFARVLRAGRYFTADLSHYTAILQSTTRRYLPTAKQALEQLCTETGGLHHARPDIDGEYLSRLTEMSIDWAGIRGETRKAVLEMNDDD